MDWAGEGLGRSAHPLRGAVYWDRGQHSAFPSHLRNGSWVWALLYVIVDALPQLGMHVVIFSPLYFLCMLLPGGDIYPGTSTAVKGPRSQPVSGSL